MAEKQSNTEDISPSTSKKSKPLPDEDPSPKLPEESKELEVSTEAPRNDGNKRLKRLPDAKTEQGRISEPVEANKNYGTGPGGMLPDEIWERILEELSDSKDIQNFFWAFPDLHGRILKNSFGWLFEQVMPHIFLFVSKKDTLSCRRVCRRWSLGVDSFLENHPCRRAYNRETEITGQHWIPEASLLHSKVNGQFEIKWEHIPFQRLQLLDMYEHPQDRNPLVGRAIKINAFHSPDFDLPWDEVLTLFRNCGRHIWFLDISFHFVVEGLYFCQLLKEILECLPNLKELKITADDLLISEIERHLKAQGNQLPLPALDQLESVEVYPSSSSTLLDILAANYSQQIRWLRTDGRLWKSEYCNLFPNLTELDLYDSCSLPDATSMLTDLEAPELYRLGFGMYDCRSSAIGSTIIPLLARFPRLHSLTIRLEGIQCGRSILPLANFAEPINSLKSFCLFGLTDEHMNFRFLRFLPKLEYVYICYNRRLPYYFRESNIFKPGLWELLPKLKEVALRGMLMAVAGPRHYFRSQYESKVAKVLDRSRPI